MRFKKEYFPLSFIVPAFIIFIPVELFFINGLILQRIKIGGHFYPIWDFIILLVPLFIFLNKKKSKPDFLSKISMWIVFVACCNFIFRNSTSLPQSLGLLFLHSSILIFHFCRHYDFSQKAQEALLSLLTKWVIAAVTLGGLLVIISALNIDIWDNFTTTFDRFEGKGVRLRWAARRGSEHIVVSMLSAYCMIQYIEKKASQYLLPIFLFILWQIITSSRGGILLVFISSLIPYFFYSVQIKEKNRNIQQNCKIIAITIFSTILITGYLFNNEAFHILISEFSEIAREDSIRSLMTEKASVIFYKNPIFGQGYFDIFDDPNWKRFNLADMLVPIHNLFLQFSIYIGLIGVIPYLLIFIILIFKFVNKLRIINKFCIETKIVYFVGFGAFLGGIYLFVFQSLDRPTAYLLWSLVGITDNKHLYTLRNITKE
jgi:hypothetical protein